MTSRPQSNFLSLPPELIENITKQVALKRDLAGLRMACKTLDKPVANELFKFVYLSPAEKDLGTWNSISEHDVIRRIARHVVVHTQADVEDHGGFFSGERERDEIGKNFKTALAALSRYPNLDSVEIGFTPECKGRDVEYWEEEPAEDIARRVYMLKLIFKAIKDRAADAKNKTIRKLTITNLQNCPIPEFTSSELFRDVMSQLEELHISLVQEYNEHGPDHDYTKIELQTFPTHFLGDWLKPISNNLKALSIYHKNENWGPFPGEPWLSIPDLASSDHSLLLGHFDFSGIEFSKLETLALGYYTLAHDSDLDWIAGIKSLRKLVLHNCMIASYIRIDSDNMTTWKIPTQDWDPMPGDHGDRTFKYGGRWSTYLDRIADGLPNLVDFRFDQGGGWRDNPYGVGERAGCGVRIYPKRYVVFDNGILPTHWPEAEEDGELYTWLEGEDGFPNLHEQCMEEDQKSLDRLLEKTRSRL